MCRMSAPLVSSWKANALWAEPLWWCFPLTLFQSGSSSRFQLPRFPKPQFTFSLKKESPKNICSNPNVQCLVLRKKQSIAALELLWNCSEIGFGNRSGTALKRPVEYEANGTFTESARKPLWSAASGTQTQGGGILFRIPERSGRITPWRW